MNLRPIQHADLRPLREALLKDSPELVLPTHVLVTEDQGTEKIVGYGSAGVARLIAGWTDPAVSDADSITALRDLQALAGPGTLVICAAPDCRFRPFLKEEGWTEGKTVTVFFKRVKGQ